MMLAILVSQAQSAANTVSYQLLAGSIGGVVAPFVGAIGLLWRRIDRDAQKCVEDRTASEKDRAKENGEWFARVEVLYREHGAKIDDIYKNNTMQTSKMFEQIVKMVEKSEEAKHVTIAAIADTSKSLVRVEQAINTLVEKTSETSADLLKVLHERKS